MNLKFTPDNVYLVGGSVRDSLLKKKVNDFDFVIKCKKENFENEAKTFLFENFKKEGFLIGKQFPPTIRVVKDDIYIDITLMIKNIEFDALRRDFTINSIYLKVDNNELIDPLNGINDLKNKIIKLSSNVSFNNDPIRMLRAIRLSGQLNFKIHKDCYMQIIFKKKLIHNSSIERIRDEIEKIFLLKKRFILFKYLEKTGLLFEIFPELSKIKGLPQKKYHKFDVLNHSLNILKYIPDNISRDETLIYCYTAIFHDLGKSKTNYMHTKFSVEIARKILNRIKVKKKIIKITLELIDNHMKILQISLNNIKENTLKKLVFYHFNIIEYLVNFAKFEAKTKAIVNEKYYKVCNKLLAIHKEFKHRKDFIFNLINGEDILKAGIPSGKNVGIVLNKLRFEIFKNNINSRKEALKILNSLKNQL